MRLNNRGNWTLIGLLVTAAIIAVLAVVLLGNTTTVGKDSDLLTKETEKKTVLGKSIDTAKAEDCRQRINQIKLGVANYKAMGASESNPPTLKDIGLGVSTDYYYCPVSGKAYEYDPASGVVRCPTHPDF